MRHTRGYPESFFLAVRRGRLRWRGVAIAGAVWGLGLGCTGEIADDAGPQGGLAGTGPAGERGREPGAASTPSGMMATSPGTTSPTAPSSAEPPGTPPPLVTDCGDVRQRGVARPAVRRLNRAELMATLHDVWGPNNPLWTLDKQLAAYGDLVDMSDVSKFDQLYSFEQAMQWAIIVDEMAPKMPRSWGGSCFGQATITEPCWTSFFTTVGRKVFRRPLGAAEVAGMVAQVKDLPTADGVYQAFSMLFRAPDFLFHVETGTTVDGLHVRLTSHEVANRISYAITGTMPDKTLADAADGDALKTLPQVEAQVRRLIESPKAKDKLKVFFGEWLSLANIARPDYGYVTDRLKLSNGHTVQQESIAELLEFALHIIWNEKGTFKDLMTKQIAFPRNESMQKIFEAPSSLGKDGTTPVASPYHAGIAVRPAVMLGAGSETSPILRGAFVKRRILCDDLASPDFAAVAGRFEEVGTLDPKVMPNYQITAKLTAAPDCMTCHREINPIGFMYEGFNPVGMRRTEQVVYKDFYTVAARHPIPSPINDLVIEPGLPTTYDSPLKLAASFGAARKVKACTARYLFRHVERRAETQADSCLLNEAVKVLEEGKPVLDMFVKAVANEDIFWRRAP